MATCGLLHTTPRGAGALARPLYTPAGRRDSLARWPRISIDFMDVQPLTGPPSVDPSLLSSTRNYQGADFDPSRQKAYVYPYGPMTYPLGVLLVLDDTKPFSSLASWAAYDLTSIITPRSLGDMCRGFGGGCIDDPVAPTHLYLSPLRNFAGGGITPGTVAVRAILSDDLSKQTAYETFDTTLATPTPPHTGWFGCCYSPADGYVYFAPANDIGYGSHGVFLRYNTSHAFTDNTSGQWQSFDLTGLNPAFTGYQSVIASGSYIYLLPYGLGGSQFVRYDTTQPFTSASAYQAFDLATLDTALRPRSMTGAQAVGPHGRSLVMIPFRDLAIQPAFSFQQLRQVPVLYDTSKALSDRSAYAVMNLYDSDPVASGYEYGWSDAFGLVWFVVTGLYDAAQLPRPTLAVWDSAQPFSSASAWHAYDCDGLPPSLGAAYNAGSDTAYLAGYNPSHNAPFQDTHGVITRLRASAPTAERRAASRV